ncbi:zf-HC2 domain-containing protein [Treponema sp. OMZ 792]|uniref:anti-sigma factor family protein n=1 Tax=unclassified Treponema TaxID=2638727 RepID=UPI0020A54927|nr:MULTISPECIES: zf-HC2 domain-containing protein [unclassified Treponema]UTC75064.1 zf-HC2 domain-containing protein [Treponema sp. OMZ 792]UTC76582.1 zf-HC2 domain-containing protein [Treponema sp. OMZ 799]UTC81460.1 zf-HC2 domain-containing protein [Treponema sp. OMZ 798]
MSTCPDKDLYSAYVDGELQSPWKEKIEAHLASCEKCSIVVDSYKKISLKLSENSFCELDLEGSFLKLYAKRQDCLKRMELNKNKPTSWFYKSNRIPVPALAAAALFLFVLTPIIMLSTQKTLAPSDSVAEGEFKSIDPIVSDFKLGNDLKPVNKFKLNVSNVLGVNENSLVFEGKKRGINLRQYVNLYLPSSNKEEFDILKQEIKPQVLFLSTQKITNLTSVNNGQ